MIEPIIGLYLKLQHPIVIAMLIFFIIAGVSFLIWETTDHTGHAHAQPTQTVSQPTQQTTQVNTYRAWQDDGRINKRYEPTWDDDPILYNVTDGEDKERTPQLIIREWTPWGNPDYRCVANPKGGTACFPVKERTNENIGET